MEKLVYLTTGTRWKDWFITTYRDEKTIQQTCNIYWNSDVEYTRMQLTNPPTVK